MKYKFLVIIFTLCLASISYAGGDDRDQQLPLNSLNTEQNIDEDAAPRFLQENDEIAQDEEIQQGQKEIEALIQTKLAEQKNLEPSSDEQTDEVISSNSNAQTFIDRYIKSDQGILIMLFLFVVSLILVFMLLLIAFRNSLYLLASFLTLVIGLIWTTTFALLFFKELNLISIAFAILFIGLGIDFSIHYLLRTYEFSSKEFRGFLLSTNSSITNALLLTAIAIAIGFFSFAFTSFQGLAQLGIIAGTGMFISL